MISSPTFLHEIGSPESSKRGLRETLEALPIFPSSEGKIYIPASL